MDGLLEEVIRLRQENETVKAALQEVLEHNNRMQIALVDVISSFKKTPEIRISGERVEAWYAALVNQ